jgi:protein-S-isoprenylcysteine O-methyltransferase Ste14
MSINENVMVLATFLLFFLLAFIWPSLRVWRQTGHSPYVLPSSDDAYGFVTRCMKMLMVGLLAYTVSQAFWPRAVNDIGLFQDATMLPLRILAWAGLAGALAWTLCAQFQMGQSWRIGIDKEVRTPLVTSGLFAWSRNPIFLAMRVCLAALTLLQPNAITLTLLLTGDLVMQFQVRLEEAFLREQHSATYADYCARVRRWL